MPLRQFLRRKTIESFDEQWRALPEGSGLLSDERFRGDVVRILCEEELCIDPAWFAGKRVLDAGCGNGRWTYGFLRLGAEVTALDASQAACDAVRKAFPGEPRLEVIHGDVLAPSPALSERRFDLVFAWGLLHHTGDARLGLRNLCRLADEDGFVYLYLYGRGSLRPRTRARVELVRFLLLPFSAKTKRKLLSLRYSGDRLHGAYDLLSPPINRRFREADVRRWFAEEGFTQVRRTIRHSELFLEAWRPGAAVVKGFREPRDPPYWFQKLASG